MRIVNKPKKNLGQNFLIDKNIINKIVNIGNIDKNKTMKPAAAYLAFYNNNINKKLLNTTLTDIIKSGLDKTDAEFKLKKTYKNRFFLKK